MTTQRQDSDPASISSLRRDTSTLSIPTSIPGSTLLKMTSSVPSINTADTLFMSSSPTPLSSSESRVETSGQRLSFTSAAVNEVTSSSSSSAAATASSTTISWGPVITASPFPSTETSGPDSSTQQSGSSLSKGSKEILIVTTVIGGVFVLAFLIYALYRRRKGATATEIIHFRRHQPSTILSPSHLDDRLTALPIYRESRYSIHSSKHLSRLSLPASLRKNLPVPPPVAERFQRENTYIQAWKSSNPPQTPKKDYGKTFLVDATPPPPPLKEPEKVRVSTRSVSSSRLTRQTSSEDTTKSGLAISVAEPSPIGMIPESPPDSPHSQQNLQTAQDRWSWTNSQAPTTPRMYAPSSRRSSQASLPRFRTVKSWVQNQSKRTDMPHPERIDEERPSTANALSKPALKSKASRPTLAPKKLSKTKHSQVGSITSLFRPSAKVDTESKQASTAPEMEMSERLDRSQTLS